MASLASVTASQTESQSSRGPHITQWLPQLVLGALISVCGASAIGLALSAVVFSRPEEMSKRGHGIAQSFVMFAVSTLLVHGSTMSVLTSIEPIRVHYALQSMTSLFYIPLHLLACRRGESLYLSIDIPYFLHELHAWANMAIQVTVALWATAIIPVVVGIHRGLDAQSTVYLKVDMFACATGLVFSGIVLAVLRFAHRPFALPWLSPLPFDEEAGTERDFDSLEFKDKSPPSLSEEEESTTTSSSPRGIRSISPPSIASGGSTASQSASSSSSSSGRRARARSRSSKMALQRRYVRDGYASSPAPVASIPVRLAMPAPAKRQGRQRPGSSSAESASDVASAAESSGTGGTAPTSACSSTADPAEAKCGDGNGGGGGYGQKQRPARARQSGPQLFFAAAAAAKGAALSLPSSGPRSTAGSAGSSSGASGPGPARKKLRSIGRVAAAGQAGSSGEGGSRGRGDKAAPPSVTQAGAGEGPLVIRFRRKAAAQVPALKPDVGDGQGSGGEDGRGDGPSAGGGGGGGGGGADAGAGEMDKAGSDGGDSPPSPASQRMYRVPGAWISHGVLGEGAEE
ncbi:hypothetical protein VTJ83DRAFT_3814 [Remersonia thermophila]|uniref:Uncharacterized protein n=1 Tax=Remersonia thermophila TaxID=72144 RepID=A0ABR4DF31_9PEZI